MWISATGFQPDDDNPKLSQLDRQKFLLWIAAAEFPPDDIFISPDDMYTREIVAVDLRHRISARR